MAERGLEDAREVIPPLNDLGARLRSARRRKGLTLKEVAQVVGCSSSMLSKIETDHATPSLRTLHRITSALDTSIAHLFSEARPQGLSLCRRGERPSVRVRPRGGAPAIFVERLSPTFPDQLLDANIHVLEPGAESGGDISHAGEEVGYVLEGRVELQVDGEAHVLEAGEFVLLPVGAAALLPQPARRRDPHPLGQHAADLLTLRTGTRRRSLPIPP